MDITKYINNLGGNLVISGERPVGNTNMMVFGDPLVHGPYGIYGSYQVNVPGNSAWINEGQATIENGIYAHSTMTVLQLTDWLVGTVAEFDVDGFVSWVTVEVKARSAGSNSLVKLRVALMKNGQIFVNNAIPVETVSDSEVDFIYYAFSGSIEDWGTTLTADEINNGELSIAVQAQNEDEDFGHQIDVDYVRVTISMLSGTVDTGMLDLFIAGRGSINYFYLPLYTKGCLFAWKDLPLYTYGNWNDDIPLYISGTYYTQIYLYTYGHDFTSESIDLFTDGVLGEDDNITLYISGTIVLNEDIPLYIYGNALFNNDLDLYIRGITLGFDSLSLYIGGKMIDIDDTIDLFVQNDAMMKTCNLYVRGRGYLPNGLSINNALNLYLARYPSEAIPLFLCTASGYPNADIDAFIKGSVKTTEDLDLSIPNTKDFSSKKLNLIISGW